MTTEADSLEIQIKEALIRSLRLPMKVDDIGDETPLFGEGLGLDSIDVLELVLELERTFGVSIEDEQTGMAVLRSVDSIAAFINARRAAKPA
jgi:acyl carrier protein